MEDKELKEWKKKNPYSISISVQKKRGNKIVPYILGFKPLFY